MVTEELIAGGIELAKLAIQSMVAIHMAAGQDGLAALKSITDEFMMLPDANTLPDVSA